MPTTRKPRVQLVIRCGSRPLDRLTLKPRGRVCGKLFTSTRAYRSRADWIERARSVGWRISPLKPDKTVDACCPKCSGMK